MSAEIRKKINASFDPVQASALCTWIKDVLVYGKKEDVAKKVPTEIKEGEDGINQIHAAFMDGSILLELLAVMYPDCPKKKIGKGTNAIVRMENIGKFITGVTEGIPKPCQKADMFTSADLFEKGNIPQVMNGINAFSRKSHDLCDDPEDPFGFPTFGAKESTECKREFTKEQLEEGKNIIGLQAGSNKGASQAGMNMGKTRAVLD